jgi:hypothetical protein
MALMSLTLMMAALAATPADVLPPPGLYRVEVDGVIKGPDQVTTAMRQTTDANGSTVARNFLPNGQVAATATEQGNGPMTQCIKPLSQEKALASLAAVAGAGACVASGGGVVENGSLVTRQKCPFGEFKHTVTKVDNITWEYRVDAMVRPVSTGGGMMANFALMKSMLENAKVNAPTAKEREKAAAALIELEQKKGELAQQAAQIEALQPEIAKMQAEARRHGVPPQAGGMVSQGVTRLTRIGDSCSVARK